MRIVYVESGDVPNCQDWRRAVVAKRVAPRANASSYLRNLLLNLQRYIRDCASKGNNGNIRQRIEDDAVCIDSYTVGELNDDRVRGSTTNNVLVGY